VRRPLVILISLVSLFAVGCGARSTEADDLTAGELPAADYPVIGATDPERDLLLEILAKTQPQGLETVAFGGIPEDAAGFDPVPGTKWLTFEYAAGADEESYIEALWRSAIATTAFRRATEVRGLPLVTGYTVRSRSQDDQVLREEMLSIEADLFNYEPIQEADEIRTRLSQVKAPGLKLLLLDIVEPGGAAPIITLETSDAQALKEDSRGVGSYLGQLSLCEGYLIRVVDPEGRLLWIQASASRAGHSLTWAHPDLEIET
jgi:hypothetical protein